MNTSEFIADHEFRRDLKIARAKARMTQKEVAAISGLSISTICNIENPDKAVEYLSVLKYIDAIGFQMKLVAKPDFMKDKPE